MKRNYLKQIKITLQLVLVGLTVGCSVSPVELLPSPPISALPAVSPLDFDVQATTCNDQREDAYRKGYAAGQQANHYYNEGYGYNESPGKDPLGQGYYRYQDARDLAYERGFYNGYQSSNYGYGITNFETPPVVDGALNCKPEIKEEVITEEVVEFINEEQEPTDETRLLLCAQKGQSSELACEELD